MPIELQLNGYEGSIAQFGKGVNDTPGTDSLFCGKATPVATVHRTVAKSRLSSPLF